MTGNPIHEDHEAPGCQGDSTKVAGGWTAQLHGMWEHGAVHFDDVTDLSFKSAALDGS
jgi:hypothetical protein